MGALLLWTFPSHAKGLRTAMLRRQVAARLVSVCHSAATPHLWIATQLAPPLPAAPQLDVVVVHVGQLAGDQQRNAEEPVGFAAVAAAGVPAADMMVAAEVMFSVVAAAVAAVTGRCWRCTSRCSNDALARLVPQGGESPDTTCVKH